MIWKTKKILINKKIFIICLFILLIFNEFTLSFVDKDPPLSSNTIYIVRILDLFIIFIGLIAQKIFYNFRDLLIVSLITVILFLFVNFGLVYFSPKLMKVLPQDVPRYVSTCYRTLFHHDDHKYLQLNFVFGDSFSEGAGDEFLDNDPEYGIFKKLTDLKEKNLIFGRGGYGNQSTVIEFERCFPLISKYTSLSLNLKTKHTVTFVFYEGNDLNNNLSEDGRKYSSIMYKTKFFFPLFDYAFNKGLDIFSWFIASDLEKPKRSNNKFYPVSTQGIKIGNYPQSAATELTNEQVDKSLGILQKSLNKIKFMLPEATGYRLLYIPSVASSYEFKDVLRVQSYKGDPFFETTAESNIQRSLYIRKRLKEISSRSKWKYCDTTQELLNMTNLGIAIHGPIDWKHLNKRGYSTVADIYNKCFFER